MSVKRLLEAGKEKFGGVSQLQRELVKAGVEITTEGIRKAIEENRNDNVRALYSALNRIVNDGDWKKTGKLIDKE